VEREEEEDKVAKAPWLEKMYKTVFFLVLHK